MSAYDDAERNLDRLHATRNGLEQTADDGPIPVEDELDAYLIGYLAAVLPAEEWDKALEAALGSVEGMRAHRRERRGGQA